MNTEEQINESQKTDPEFQISKRTFLVGDMVTYKPLGERNKIYWKRGLVIEVLTGSNEGMYLVKFKLRSIDENEYGKIGWQNLFY